MNNLRKFSRAILAIAMILCVVFPSLAHDFEVDGIYYNYLDKTAKTVAVTYKGNSYSSYANEYSGSVSIPSSVKYSGTTYSVTSIGEDAFYNCTGLTSVRIPNSVTSIDNSAFYWCDGLTSVTIPNSVTSIGSYAFEGCTGLTSVTIPNSVTSIGDYVFRWCTGLTSITIPNSVTSIGYDAFSDCTGLTEVNIFDLSAWCKIDFGNTSANPLNYAEKLKLNGSEIKDLVIPNDITEIKNYAFEGCTGLTSVTIPNSVTSIGDGAFSDCTGLTSVTIPNSVTSIGDYAFYDCDGLTEVNISDLSAWCKIVFEDYDSNPLYYAKKLKLNGSEIKDLVIPNDITEIKNSAFYGCTGLTSVVIGKSVKTISENAFNYTRNLKTIISLNPTPPSCVNSPFYSDNYSEATLYVPKDSYAKYFINDVWGKFKNIKKIETLVSSIKLNNTSIELDKGSTATLTATITPSNATIKNVIWESSNPQVAKVDQSGIVTALSAGTATITATAVDGSEVSTSCKVVVKGVDTKITLSQTEAIMLVNDIITLTYSVTPSIVSVEWSTSNSNVVYIKKNSDNSVTVVGIADGEAIVTARTTDGSGASASCKVVVSSDPKITLSQSEAKLEIDDIIILSYTITGTPIQTASWSTSDASVAKIKANSNGTVAVTGIADGIAIITATLVYPSGVEFSASCEVTVGVGGVEGVEADENSIEVSRYDIHGRLLSEPTKGINIIKMSDGTTRKEIVK